MTEYRIEVAFSELSLPIEQYWLSVALTGLSSGNEAYITTTTLKNNAVGSPATLDGKSFKFVEFDNTLPLTADFSMGITAVPEPSSLALVGLAAAGVAWRQWRKRRQLAAAA